MPFNDEEKLFILKLRGEAKSVSMKKISVILSCSESKIYKFLNPPKPKLKQKPQPELMADQPQAPQRLPPIFRTSAPLHRHVNWDVVRSIPQMSRTELQR
jgi:hypothetical protein